MKLKCCMSLLVIKTLSDVVFSRVSYEELPKKYSSMLPIKTVKDDEENESKWIYWQFRDNNTPNYPSNVLMSAGFATNLCILWYTETTFKFAYILKKTDQDMKCQIYDKSKIVSFLEFRDTIFQTKHIYDNSNIYISFSQDGNLPIPVNAPFATNITYNNGGSCKEANRQQARQFVAYPESKCIAVQWNIGDVIFYVKYNLPRVRYYGDRGCKYYSTSVLIPQGVCHRPALAYDTDNELEFLDYNESLSHSTLSGSDLDSIITSFHQSSQTESETRQLSTSKTVFDDDWSPPNDDLASDDAWRNPFQIFEKWSIVHNIVDTTPTAAPASASGTWKPSIQPTTSPTKAILYYQFTVIQRLLNVQIDTLTADELSRAVFSKAVSVLVGLPYSAIQIVNITDTQPSTTYLQLSEGAALTSLHTTMADPFAANSHLSLTAALERLENNSVSFTGYVGHLSDALDSSIRLLSFMSLVSVALQSVMLFVPFGTQPSCFVTYNIVFSPAQLNHTDPNEAYQQIKSQLTKRAVSGIQTISIKYFATNKNTTSLLKVNARNAPIISGFTLLPSDIPNYPVGHSTTDNVMAITVLSLTIAGGITILLTLVWFVSCISGSVRVFVDNNIIGTVEPQFVDVEMAPPLVVDGEPPAVVVGELRQEHERTQVEVIYTPDQADNDGDLSVHSMQ